MSSNDRHKKVLAIAAFITPVLAVKASTILVKPAPQSANATQTTTVAAVAAEAPKPFKPSREQLDAAKYIQTASAQPFAVTPFLYEHTPAVEAPTEEPTPEPTPVATPTATPKFTLGATLASASGRRALINGKPYSEGDIIKNTTWKVDSIDAAKRTVTLSDTTSDRSITVSVETP